ncbi:MAG: Lipopolysaccharide export system ATP-binding protein LptB [Syntrophorhabdus sp. PtaU1.Bin058]|nr:MAG: Lipopolysaccharide export system ATP-binding protein LptB [Syntrophorhabdus sp. PtaU1.Bin058]
MKIQGKQRFSSRFRDFIPILIVCMAAALTSYLLGPGRYTQRIILLVVLWAIASSSFNIISGYGGQVVFGYMMFVGTGAYTTVLLFKFLAVSPWFGMWVGVIAAVVTALIIGLPTLRLHGAFFAVATVAFPLITFPILNHLGFEELSIPFIGHGASSMQFRDMRFYVLIATALLAIVLAIAKVVESSRFGFALRALKQNETAAESMGINTYRTKLMAFLLSAGMGALMGTLYAFGLLYVLTTHSVFGTSIIVKILSITIVGGIATVWGPPLAACLLVPIGEFLNSQFGNQYPGVQDIIYGVALIASILYMPEGIWGKIRGAFRSRPPKSPVSTEPLTVKGFTEKVADKPHGCDLFVPEPIQPATSHKGTDEPILRMENISKFFGGVHALRDVTIEVPRGKIIGVIGPNGSGKTTLFNVINGFLKPETGRITFEGQDITRLRPHSSCKLGIGRTFQVPQVLSSMTVLENIMIGAFNVWGNASRAHAEAEKVVHQVGLSNRAHDRAVGLTMWETKMLEFSRALATRPRLLLVDEPMAGLNPEEANRIGEIITAIGNSGITVIVIEHIVHSLVKIADWMVGLDDGNKVTEGLPREVISDPHIIEAYLGAKWRERHVGS